MLYYKFSDYLKKIYGEKVYKLPVNIPATCPNRDGTAGMGGCSFCGEEGAGFELLSSGLGVKEQLLRNAAYMGGSFGSRKFIAYFQNFSNTYMELSTFKGYIADACQPGIAAVYISTRPDCVNDAYLAFLAGLKAERGVDIVLELGLQTVNYHALKALNRGHMLAEFIDAVLRIKRYGLECCAHYIVDLPMDGMDDVAEGARILSALGVDQVKCHSLYILEGTAMGELYREGSLRPVELGEYIERVITFLEYLNPGTVIQRLVGRAPEERSLFCNWGMSWWKIRDMIEEKMADEGRYQGARFNYLNGGLPMKRLSEC